MRIEVNGAFLSAEVTGQGNPLVLLHGFTGSAASWSALTGSLSNLKTIAVDLIGHGRSDCPDDPARYSMPRCVQDLASLMKALEVEKAGLLGYSMGGRVALHFALMHPEMVQALVVESASPGFSDPAEREARIRADVELADRIERGSIEAFVDYWEQLPLWASQSALPPDRKAALRRQRLRNSPRGLANSLRGMGAGAQEPIFDRLGELRMPALFLAGAQDERFARLAKEMAARVVNGQVCVLSDTGHAAHLERPDEFAATVVDFLTKNASGEGGGVR